MEISAELTHETPGNWCVTIATPSFKMSISVAVVMNTNFLSLTCCPRMDLSISYSTAAVFVVQTNILFICVKFILLFIKSRTQHTQHSVHWQTKNIKHGSTRTKTCLLTFLSSLGFHLNTVTMTFTSLMAETDDNWQYAHLPVTETEHKMAPGADETNWDTKINKTKQNKKTQQLSKSLFTAAQTTGTENKHQTVKNTALNTLLGGVSPSADGNKRNWGCTEHVKPMWCCHGNHIPLWWWETNLERVRAQDRQANTHKHTTSICLWLYSL